MEITGSTTTEITTIKKTEQVFGVRQVLVIIQARYLS